MYNGNLSTTGNSADIRVKFQANASSYGNIVAINCIINGIMMLVTILGNCLVSIAIWKTSSLRSPSTMFLFSLAISDLLVGLIVQPVYIAKSLIDVYFLQILTALMAFAACGVSLGTMAAISLDRFLALHYHLRYNALMTSFRATSALLTIWITTFLLSCLIFWDSSIYIAVLTILISAYLITSANFYVRIYQIVLKHRSQIQHREPGNQQLSVGQLSSQKKLIGSALSTFVFYICTVTCYLPRFISLTLTDTNTYKKTAWILADTLIFFNSAINPLLYCWRLPDLRAAVVKYGGNFSACKIKGKTLITFLLWMHSQNILRFD
ncbi:melanocyte-stimulating hormone receptor-like [Pocillopora verrucosa]|uniref:melanocyte-stimulating hormone receptor-like n=1 Tax=Pocillopora verrucosa TaxID=203993 RepID=UPI00333E4FD0